MRAPHHHITVQLVEDEAFARHVAPRCGELPYNIIDNRFVKAMGMRQIWGMLSGQNLRWRGFAEGRGARLVDEADPYPERLFCVYVLDSVEYEASKKRLVAE